MKHQRQEKLLELTGNRRLKTQAALVKALHREGFEAERTTARKERFEDPAVRFVEPRVIGQVDHGLRGTGCRLGDTAGPRHVQDGAGIGLHANRAIYAGGYPGNIPA